VPLRGLAQRLGVFVLALAGVGLIVLGKVDPTLTERARTAVSDITVPILEAMARPVVAANRAVDAVYEAIFIYHENDRLRDDNARLIHWQEVARRLEQDNAALRQLMNATLDPPFSYVTARVVGDPGGPFVHTVLLNAGERDGVEKAQAVVADTGLIGRIAETGQRSARVLLMTDLNSRIPVVAGRDRHRAVLSGDNNTMPVLDYVPAGADLKVGDQVATSGDGGVYPPGLPVGTIEEINDGVARVRTAVDLGRLEFVRVLRYDQPRLPSDRRVPKGGRR
jgi:rod shape-determining protein MreC